MCTKINETNKTKFEELMNGCINVTNHDEASSFVREVEDFIISNGINSKFYYYYVMQEYESFENVVNIFIKEHNLEEDCEFPEVGFKWLPCDNRLVLGIYDGIGGFEEYRTWEFDV
jgi:hypothetical protein